MQILVVIVLTDLGPPLICLFRFFNLMFALSNKNEDILANEKGLLSDDNAGENRHALRCSVADTIVKCPLAPFILCQMRPHYGSCVSLIGLSRVVDTIVKCLLALSGLCQICLAIVCP